MLESFTDELIKIALIGAYKTLARGGKSLAAGTGVATTKNVAAARPGLIGKAKNVIKANPLKAIGGAGVGGYYAGK